MPGLGCDIACGQNWIWVILGSRMRDATSLKCAIVALVITAAGGRIVSLGAKRTGLSWARAHLLTRADLGWERAAFTRRL
jgi:hypothetical protein